MSSFQLEQAFKYLPAGTSAVWVLTTGYFNRPDGEHCSTGQQVGLGFITAILALVCWVRSSVCLYACRKERRCSCKGWLWKALSVIEGGVTTLLFLAVALVTPPGSTCFFPGDKRLPTFTTYNILAGATLLAFAAPRLLGWMMTFAEAFGCNVRTPVPEHVRDIPYIPEPTAPAYVHAYALVRKAFHSKPLELHLWQLLPAGTVALYQVATAYWTQYATDACTPNESAWLIAFIAIVGTIGFLINLESYDKDRTDPDASKVEKLRFRNTPWWYNVLSLGQTVLTTTAFVGVALLTPPGSICFFGTAATNGFIQRLSAYVLAPMAAGLVAIAFLKVHLLAASAGVGADADLEMQRHLSSQVPRTEEGAAAAADEAGNDGGDGGSGKKLKPPKGGYSIAVSAETTGPHTLGDDDNEETASPTAGVPVV